LPTAALVEILYEPRAPRMHIVKGTPYFVPPSISYESIKESLRRALRHSILSNSYADVVIFLPKKNVQAGDVPYGQRDECVRVDLHLLIG